VRLAYDGLELEVASGEWRVAKKSEKPRSEKATSRSMAVFSSGAEWAGRFGSALKKSAEQELTPRAERNAEHAEEQETQTAAGATGRGSVVAVGNFDGVHLGHQRLLAYCIALARETGAVATTLTFEPPPLKVLRPETAPQRISTNEQRMEWFAALGLEAAVVLPFTMELARMTPEDFVDDILVRQLQVRAVVVGDNFRFGHKHAGDVKSLRELGMRNGFDVIVHRPVMFKGEIVSSSLVRKYVADGKVTRAARVLGRPFVLTGEVVPGTGIGRKFTFPTINLRPEQELLPAKGVYITRTVLEGETRSRRSLTNVGMRPTFNGTGLTVETHLLDYSGDVTTKRIEVRFWKRLREEKKFSGAEELKAQIVRDIGKARAFFERLRGIRQRRMASEAWREREQSKI